MGLNKQKLKSVSLILSWAFYDLANQFFALNVVSLYFVLWLTVERNKPEFFYGIAFAISSLFVAILGLILGAISDTTGRYKPFLVWLTLIAVIFTMVLGVSQNIYLALLFFILANFGCQTAIIFYNSLMINITPKGKIGLVSGLGKMFGYSGAILSLYLIKPIVLKSGFQATFLPTGICFLIFSLPCLIFIKDSNPQKSIQLLHFLKKERIIAVFKTLKETAFNVRKFPGLLDFFKASFFGLCAVNIIILFMSVYATRVFRFNESQIIDLIAFSTLFAIAGSISSGFISDRIGYKLCMCLVFSLWGICFLLGAFVRNTHLYWLIGALVGITLGSTWVVSRALAIRLIPKEKIGEMFGLFNLVGYLSSIAGALFWAIILLFLARLGELGYRIALSSLILFIALGLFFAIRIPEDRRKVNE